MSYDIKQSSTQSALLFFLTLASDHLSPATGLSPTVTLSKNGAAFASPSGAVTEIANGWYKVAGNATDTNTLGPLALHASVATADNCDLVVGNIVAFDPQATPLPRYTGTAQAGAASTITLANGTSSLQAGVGDLVVITSGTGVGESGIILSTSGMGGSTPIATMTQAWQSIAPDSTSHYEIVKIGQLIPAQPSDVWNNTSAPTRVLTAPTNITSDGTSAARESTLGSPSAGSVSADIAATKARLPATLVFGRIDANVGSVATIAVQTSGSGTQNIGGP